MKSCMQRFVDGHFGARMCVTRRLTEVRRFWPWVKNALAEMELQADAQVRQEADQLAAATQQAADTYAEEAVADFVPR